VNEKTAELLGSFEEYFLINGMLTEKQFQVLRSIVRQTIVNLSEAESFERELGSYLKSEESKKVFRLMA